MKNRDKDYIKRKNGYYNLNKDLRNKLELFENTRKSGEKYMKYFTWEEFIEVFSTITVLWCFEYRGHEYWAFNDGKKPYFYTEDNLVENFLFEYPSAKEVLLKARINSCSLKDIWSDLIIVKY